MKKKTKNKIKHKVGLPTGPTIVKTITKTNSSPNTVYGGGNLKPGQKGYGDPHYDQKAEDLSWLRAVNSGGGIDEIAEGATAAGDRLITVGDGLHAYLPKNSQKLDRDVTWDESGNNIISKKVSHPKSIGQYDFFKDDVDLSKLPDDPTIFRDLNEYHYGNKAIPKGSKLDKIVQEQINSMAKHKLKHKSVSSIKGVVKHKFKPGDLFNAHKAKMKKKITLSSPRVTSTLPMRGGNVKGSPADKQAQNPGIVQRAVKGIKKAYDARMQIQKNFDNRTDNSKYYENYKSFRDKKKKHKFFGLFGKGAAKNIRSSNPRSFVGRMNGMKEMIDNS